MYSRKYIQKKLSHSTINIMMRQRFSPRVFRKRAFRFWIRVYRQRSVVVHDSRIFRAWKSRFCFFQLKCDFPVLINLLIFCERNISKHSFKSLAKRHKNTFRMWICRTFEAVTHKSAFFLNYETFFWVKKCHSSKKVSVSLPWFQHYFKPNSWKQTRDLYPALQKRHFELWISSLFCQFRPKPGWLKLHLFEGGFFPRCSDRASNLYYSR